jgi:NADH-quinone oxidoreductase subunit J
MAEFGVSLVFYIFAALAVLGALGVVLARNPVRSALSLAVVLICHAVMYILLDAPFIAAAQVMIYAGAILILFLFVIMVLNPRLEIGEGRLRGQTTAAVVIGLALAAEIAFVLSRGALASTTGKYTPEVIAAFGHTQLIGQLLFSDFILPFEITSFLLLVAIMGVITLARRERGTSARKSRIANR